MRTIYKLLRGLKGKKLVFTRKTPKAYRLTAKGEKLASLLNALYILVEETLSSSEQVFKDNENIAPQVSGLTAARYSSMPSELSFPAEEKAETMRRSQLEMCVDILEVLTREGPLNLMRVMQNANVNCSMLRECLDFLTKQGLVEVKAIGKEKKVYAVTQLGLTVLKQFRDLKEVLPIVVETGAARDMRKSLILIVSIILILLLSTLINFRPTIQTVKAQQLSPQSISDNFSTDSGLWTYLGSAYRDPTNDYLVLTNSGNDQAGVAFFNYAVSGSFTANFSYLVGEGSYSGDGFTMFFYKQPYSTFSNGGDLGFNTQYCNYPGIWN